MFADFWEEIKTGLTPFMDPKIYARSPLECASFIASSYHMDKSIHGTGFLARLSGSTAEFLSMYHVMMYGRQPFVVDDESGELALKLVQTVVKLKQVGNVRVLAGDFRRLALIGEKVRLRHQLVELGAPFAKWF